ncbi:hypothetical protein DMA11_04405 [Marinilabiliaceae bacterium JC017]|nr:hypothetical protein DMA11_04405 [Marinilabiliaceae bacterium JC017]
MYRHYIIVILKYCSCWIYGEKPINNPKFNNTSFLHIIIRGSEKNRNKIQPKKKKTLNKSFDLNIN